MKPRVKMLDRGHPQPLFRSKKLLKNLVWSDNSCKQKSLILIVFSSMNLDDETIKI